MGGAIGRAIGQGLGLESPDTHWIIPVLLTVIILVAVFWLLQREELTIEPAKRWERAFDEMRSRIAELRTKPPGAYPVNGYAPPPPSYPGANTYVATAILNECRLLKRLPERDHSGLLKGAAYRLARLGPEYHQAVSEALIPTALSVGIGRSEARETIDSAFRAREEVLKTMGA